LNVLSLEPIRHDKRLQHLATTRLSRLQRRLLAALADGIDASALADARSAAGLLAAVPEGASGLSKLDIYSVLSRRSRYGWRAARAVAAEAHGTRSATASQVESCRRSLHTLETRGLVELASQPLDKGGHHLAVRITPDGLSLHLRETPTDQLQ
jgi:hypothetical protein